MDDAVSYIRNGDIVVLMVEKKQVEELVENVYEDVDMVDTPTEVTVKEDAIDEEYRETDGWIEQPITNACNHKKNASCTRCMPIPVYL